MSKKKKPSAGLTKRQRSRAVKQARRGKDMGKKGKNFKKIERKAAKRYGSEKAGKCVAGAVFWRTRRRKR